MSKPKWDKADKRTWTRGAYRIERRARDQFVALGPPGEGDETPGHLGCWGKLALAKAACDEHEEGLGEAAKLSVALDWHETEPGSGIWTAVTADGGRYTCTAIVRGCWRAGYCADAESQDPAQVVTLWPECPGVFQVERLCEQHHAGRGLEWREDGTDWFVECEDDIGCSYFCHLDDDGKQWLASWSDEKDDHDLGAGDNLDEAQARCQIHRGKRLLEGTGERDVKPEKPERELREWSIPVPLSDEDFEARSQKLAGLVAEIGQNTIEIARVKEETKRTVKSLEEAIGAATTKSLELAEIVEARAEHRLVKCHRTVTDGEEIYTDPDSGEEIHRDGLAEGQQGQLWGGDKPPPPASKGVQTPGAITAAGDAIDFPDEGKLTWGKIPHELIWVTKGSPTHQYRIDLKQSPGDLAITAGAPSEHVELQRWSLGAPDPNISAEVKRAKAWCRQHRDSRLRWPGDPTSGLLVSRCGKYQLSRRVDGDEVSAFTRWHAEAIGGQDEDNTDLGEHDDLQAAQAACQAHADAGKAGQ